MERDLKKMSIGRHFEKWDREECYIMTVDMDCGFVLGDTCVLWQAVTLRLVNRGMAVCRVRLVKQMFNRKETMWYENHTVRFRQSVQSELRVELGIRSRSEALVSSLTIWLARGCKHWFPLALGRRYKARRSPLSDYMSLHLSLKLTTNCVPPLRIKWDIYFYKVCFVSLIEFRKSCLIISMNP